MALHELKVLTQAHETAQQQYAELHGGPQCCTGALVASTAMARKSMRDGIDGWHNGVEAVEKASDSVQLAGAMAERERRHRSPDHARMVFGDTGAVMPVLAVHGRAIVALLDTHAPCAPPACAPSEPRRPRGTDVRAVCEPNFVRASELRGRVKVFPPYF